MDSPGIANLRTFHRGIVSRNKHRQGKRVWQTSIRVCDHHGSILDFVTTDQAQRMHSSGEYIPTGTKKTIDTLVHKGPPDQREIQDEQAMRSKGSRKAHFLEKHYSGQQNWALKGQSQPWGGLGA